MQKDELIERMEKNNVKLVYENRQHRTDLAKAREEAEGLREERDRYKELIDEVKKFGQDLANGKTIEQALNPTDGD
jgi:hypothetical protein